MLSMILSGVSSVYDFIMKRNIGMLVLIYMFIYLKILPAVVTTLNTGLHGPGWGHLPVS